MFDKKLTLALSLLFLGFAANAQLLYTEDFESPGQDGTNYRSNTFNDGGGDVWTRWNVDSSAAGPNPAGTTSGRNFFQAYSGQQGDYAFGGEDMDASDNPLGTGEPGYFMTKTLDVSSYQGDSMRVILLMGASIELNSRYEAADYFLIQVAFDSDIATGANSVGGLPTVANVETGTYTIVGAYYGGAGGGSTNMTEDTDLNGSADVSGNQLGVILEEDSFAFEVPGTATKMSVRIVCIGNSAEEAVFDNVRVRAFTGGTTCSMSASITSQTDVACFNESTGALTVTASGGTANYDYEWSNFSSTLNTSSTTNSISGLAATTYTVTVTDNNACTATASATITQPSSSLVASASVLSPIDCFGDTDGQVTASQTGGTSPYTYSWNTGETNAIETNLGATTYSVTITDQNGCTDSASVALTQPAQLVSSASVTGSIDCFGDTDGQVTASETGGTSPYTYNWNTGETDATETNLGATTYSVTITDQNGCTDSASVALTQPSQLVASASVTGSIDCFGDTDGQVTASETGGTSPYTYSWNTGETNATETNLGATTYSVTITDQNGCTDSASVALTQPTQLVASASVTGTLDCFGDTDGEVTASETGGTSPYTYSWNTGETSAIENNIGATTYSVTVTDQNGCTDSASTTLTQSTQLVASASVTGTLDCFGDTDGEVTASETGGTSPYTYSWNTGETNAIENNIGATTYSVTVTDQNGCTDSASVELTQPDQLVASASVSSAISCFGDTDGEVTASETGGTSPFTYSWNTGETNAIENNLGATTYSVTVTDQNGCTDSASVPLTQPTQLVASASVTGTLDCFGDTDGEVTASETGGTSPYTYSWNTGETNAIENNIGATTYSVTVTDQNGCTDSASTTLTQPTQLVASASVTGTLDCFGDTDGEVTASETGGTSPYTYSWNTGETNAIENNIGATTYSVTVTDQNGCTDSASIALTQPTQLVASASVTGTLDCFGDTDGEVTASETGGTSPYTYSWNTGETNAIENNIGATTYSVTVTDQNGCTDSASVALSQPDQLVASASVTDALNCFGDTDGEVTASETGGTSPFTYSWNTSETNAVEDNLGASTYSVTVTDQNGCTDSASVALSQPTQLVASASVTGTLDCFGDTDGEVTASETGGTSPYTYSWNTGETNAVENNIGATTYSVTVTDQNGCTDSASTTLTQPTELVASASVTGTLDCFGDTDGEVTASETGGTSPYTYSWNTGETNAVEDNIGATTYSVTVTDQNGCTDSTSILLTQPTALSASTVSTNVTCTGDDDGTVDLTVSGGTTSYTYMWSNSATTEDLSALGQGTYAVTVTDANNCTITDSDNVSEASTLLSVSAVASDATCNGDTDGSVDLTVTGGEANFSYSWSNSETTEDIVSLGAATYTVTVTDANGCEKSTSATVGEPAVLDPGNVSTN